MIPGLQTMTLIRRTQSIDPATGRAGTVAEVESEIQISFQPAPGEVVERLGHGFEATDIRRGFSYDRLRAAKPSLGTLSDHVAYDEGDGLERWEVNSVAAWGPLPGLRAHYETIFVRVRENV